MTRLGFGAGMIAGGLSSGIVIGAWLLATMPQSGFVCANFETQQVVDAVREGRSFVWFDQNKGGRIVPGDPEWYCTPSELNARQLTRPAGTDAADYR